MKKIDRVVFLILILLVCEVWMQFGCIPHNMRNRTVDDYTGEITISEGFRIRSNLTLSNSAVDFKIIKYILNEKNSYALKFSGFSPDVFFGNGLQIMLEDSTELNWPEAEIETDYSPGGVYNGIYISGEYIWDVFVMLTNEEMKLLCTYGIVKWKAYIFDGKADEPKKSKLLCITILKAK